MTHIPEEARLEIEQLERKAARARGCACLPVTHILNNDTDQARFKTVWVNSSHCPLNRAHVVASLISDNEVDAYFDNFDIPALARLLKADMDAYLDGIEVIKKIKRSLADYYGGDAAQIKDRDLPEMIEKLKNECLGYSLIIGSIKRIIKD